MRVEGALPSLHLEVAYGVGGSANRLSRGPVRARRQGAPRRFRGIDCVIHPEQRTQGAIFSA